MLLHRSGRKDQQQLVHRSECVSDNAGLDVGTLDAWSIDFESLGEPVCPDTSGGDDDGDDCPAGKVLVCHVPPGNSGNQHEICVGESAVEAHIEHGDYVGACVDDDGDGDAILDVPGIIPGTHGGSIDLDVGDGNGGDAQRASSSSGSVGDRDARKARGPHVR